MPFIVIYDAQALYPNTQRDLLIRVALHGLVQAKWTEEIVGEMLTARGRNHPDVPAERLERLHRLINESIPDCLVTGYEDLIEGLKLPDPDDRHVLAAAIRSHAQVIVTQNERDFPQDYLAGFGLETKSPDDFVLDQIGINAKVVFACVQQIADSREQPPQSTADVLAQLEASGMLRSAAALRSS